MMTIRITTAKIWTLFRGLSKHDIPQFEATPTDKLPIRTHNQALRSACESAQKGFVAA
jgi:hypothetical protein